MNSNHKSTFRQFIISKRNSIFAGFAFLSLIAGIFAGLSYGIFQGNDFVAQNAGTIPNESNCPNEDLQNPSNPSTFNPYKITFDHQSPLTSPCRDMPMLSFKEIIAQNPRVDEFKPGESINWQLYYNWGINGSNRIRNPKAEIQVVKVPGNNAQDFYEIRAILSGTLNGGTVSVSSADRGGHLTAKVPIGTALEIFPATTKHDPDAIERTYVLDVNDEVAPYNNLEWQKVTSRSTLIPDKSQTVSGLVSNNIYTAFPGGDFSGNTGFIIFDTVDPDYCNSEGASCDYSQTPFLRGGFLDQGFINGSIRAFTPQQNDPSYTIEKDCVLSGTTTQCAADTRKSGQQVDYTLKVTNTGPVAINNVVISDKYNTDNDGRVELINIDASNTNGGIGAGVVNATNFSITWPAIASIPAGESRTVTFKATVSTDVQDGEIILNTAYAKADNLDEIEDEYTFEVEKLSAQYEILKTCTMVDGGQNCADQDRRSGDQVEYKITVTNTGESAINNLVISDKYNTDNDGRDELTNITQISNGGTDNNAAQTITWPAITTLASGASTSVTFRATVSDEVVNNETIKNITIANASANNQALPEITDDYDFKVVTPDLDAIKRCFVKGTTTPCQSATMKPGDDITYQIIISNNSGITVFNVAFSDDYDENKIESLTNFKPTNPDTDSNGKLTWNDLGDLDDGESITVSFDATIKDGLDSGTTILNTGVVSGDDVQDIDVQDEFDIIVSDIDAIKECVQKGTQNPCETAGLTADDEITYSIKVTNDGSATLENVKIVDNYDNQKLTAISQISDNGVETGDAQITWEIGDLEPGASKTVTFDARIISNIQNNDKIINLAVVSADGKEDINLRHEFVVLINEPLLIESYKACTKLGTTTPCANASLKPGDSIEYTILIKNTGGATAKDVVLVDNYDQNLIENIRNINPTATSNDGDKITWPAVDIASGNSRSYKFTATIKPNVASGTKIDNFGIITASNHPQINVEYSFTVVIRTVAPVTPNTGGIEILGILMVVGGVGYLIYYTKKNPKWTSRFIPKRSTEIDK